MKTNAVLAITLMTGLVASPAFAAGLDASAAITSNAEGSDFDYAITLTNASSSTASIGTFWFAWKPGQDYLATLPSDITAPTGWKETVTHGGANDGYAIQFVAKTGTPLLAPGSSLSGFDFTSADTPQELAGFSNFFPETPVTTSVVYAGTPFTNPSETFVASISSVPEPGSLILAVFAIVTSIGYVRFRNGKETSVAVNG
jgi:hypothetical protein